MNAEGKPIVGIEGSHGQSRPMEKALREAGVIFRKLSALNNNLQRTREEPAVLDQTLRGAVLL